MGIIRTLSVLLVAITACWTEARPQCGLVKIDSVTGAWGPNSLLAGYVHRVIAVLRTIGGLRMPSRYILLKEPIGAT
jgi:hypothetical protein